MGELVWGLVWLGLGWFRAFARRILKFDFVLRNPCTGAPRGSSGRGWFEIGLAWFVVGFVSASAQKLVF